MTKKLLLSLSLIASLASANSYSENIQVFTANTMNKKCSNEPRVIFKGRQNAYYAWAAKNKEELYKIARIEDPLQREQYISSLTNQAIQGTNNSKKAYDVSSLALLGGVNAANAVANGASTILSSAGKSAGSTVAQGMGEGLVVGLAIGLLIAGYQGYVSDWDYLLIRECNEGVDKTRLITNVISNDELKEDVWVNMAIEDQKGSM